MDTSRGDMDKGLLDAAEQDATKTMAVAAGQVALSGIELPAGADDLIRMSTKYEGAEQPHTD